MIGYFYRGGFSGSRFGCRSWKYAVLKTHMTFGKGRTKDN